MLTVKKYGKKQFEKYISVELEEWTKDEIKKIDEVLKKYQEIAELTIYDLNYILDDVDYAFCNKKYKFIFNNLHKPLCEMLKKIRDFKRHIDLYFDGEGNQSVVIEMLFDIQDNFLFRIEEKEFEESKDKNIYFDWADNIEKKLSEMWEVVLGGEKYDVEIIPVYSKVYYKEND